MSPLMEKSIVIRDIDTHDEMRMVEDLQKEVWDLSDRDVVPLSQLAATINSGGVLLGGFDGNVLVGFVYGFLGMENGVFVHHSHMLAVRPEYRSHDVGFRLKLQQRELVIRQGIGVMSWTFDPLQSLNAYFNFNKLGVVADRYFVDFYGNDASSVLHRNGTDRLWVTWNLTSERVVARLERTNTSGWTSNLPALVEIGENDIPVSDAFNDAISGSGVVIEIPADINTIERENRELAAEWRSATRAAFSEAIGRGFTVQEFHRTGLTHCQIGTYVLNRRDHRAG